MFGSGFGMFAGLHYSQAARDAQSTARKSASKAQEARENVRWLEQRLERLTLICMAMWELLQERDGLHAHETPALSGYSAAADESLSLHAARYAHQRHQLPPSDVDRFPFDHLSHQWALLFDKLSVHQLSFLLAFNSQ